MAEGGSYYYLVDMQEKTVQPLMNALCIADNIKLEYQEVTDPYTKEKYFEYAHDGKLMGRLLIPQTLRTRNKNNDKGDRNDNTFTKSVYAGGCTAREL
jgi:predicted DNA-binding transcriptional regulator YafY